MSARLDGPGPVRGLDSLEYKEGVNQTPPTQRESYLRPSLQHAQTIAVDGAGRSAIENNVGNSSRRLSDRSLSELTLRPTPKLTLPPDLENLSRNSSVDSVPENRTSPLGSDMPPNLRANSPTVPLKFKCSEEVASPDSSLDSTSPSFDLTGLDMALGALLVIETAETYRSRPQESASPAQAANRDIEDQPLLPSAEEKGRSIEDLD